ncbi:UNVERIFIED_CONTAM: hypothetical protein FKN15_075444 [Acipenser sinensis]
MQFCANKLDKKDFFGKSDPFMVFYRSNEDGTFTICHKTEVVKNTLNPVWQAFAIPVRALCNGDYDRFTICHKTEVVKNTLNPVWQAFAIPVRALCNGDYDRTIKVEVYDWDRDGRTIKVEVYDWDRDGSHDFIGEFTTSYRELARGQSQFNVYEVTARETGLSVQVYQCCLSGHSEGDRSLCAGVPMLSLRSQRGRQVSLCRCTNAVSQVTARETGLSVQVYQCCLSDHSERDRSLRAGVPMLSHRSQRGRQISLCRCTNAVSQVTARETGLSVQVYQCCVSGHSERDRSLRAGVPMLSHRSQRERQVSPCRCTNAVSQVTVKETGLSMQVYQCCLSGHSERDRSLRAGNPSQSTSLHYMNPYQMNAYAMALKAVGEIIQDYDSDKMFPALGFGAKLPPDGRVSHEFPLNGDTENPYCNGIEGILEAYHQSLKTVQLYGPTNFAPVVNHVARYAAAVQDGSQYFILLIITDGVISDMAQTKEAIVSFVPFRDYMDRTGNHVLSMARLAKDVLAEIPEQFISYMKTRGIKPNPSPPPYTPPSHTLHTQI